MRFMVMHKVDARMEAGGPPDPKIIQAMGALVQESLKSGVFLTGAGLRPSSQRARLTHAAGHWSESHGPYTGENELLASFAMIRAESLAASAKHARAFAEANGDTEIEVGPVVEAWDLGLIPKPSTQVPQRFLLLSKAGPAFEQGATAQEARNAAVAELTRVLGENGAVLAAEVLAPSSKASRLSTAKDGKRTWVDGPFAESKELIAGFSILELLDKAQAMAWAERYAAILGDNQVDVRELL